MSRRSRRLNRRAGESYLLDSSQRLPRTQERVQQVVRHRGGGVEDLLNLFATVPAGEPIPEFDGRVERPGRIWSSVALGEASRGRLPRLQSPRYTWSQLRELYMHAPSRVRFCVQRGQRKEVLFALGKVGGAGSSPGRRRSDGRAYRRTAASRYRC